MYYRVVWPTAAAVFLSLIAGCVQYPAPQIVDYGRPAYTAPPVRAPAPAAPVPTTRVVTLGRSVQGTPIKMYVFGSGTPAILIFGGIHGDEYTSSYVARNLVFALSHDPSLYEGRTVGVIPAANPDGLAVNTRTNANGVDCNRNFPASNWRMTKRGNGFGGFRPASEPETRAIIKAVEELNPVCIVSIHTATGGTTCNNYDGPGAGAAQLMARHNGYRVLESIGYPTPGSFGTWAGVDRNIATITLELPREATGSAAWRQNKPALLALIRSY